MNKQKIRAKIENLNDGEFIELLDTLCGIEFGMTATEWIEHLYKVGGEQVRVVINELPEADIIENV